jgi:hypothetical protein
MGPSPLTVRLRIFVVAALIAVVCATSAWWPRRFQWLDDGIIVPPSRAYDFGYRLVDGYWQPSRADVAAVARALPELVRGKEGYGCSTMSGVKRLDEYVHIYSGIIDGGRKVIAVQLEHGSRYEQTELVNGKLHTTKLPWTTPIYVPNDGDNELDARYDVAAGTFDFLATHGHCSHLARGKAPVHRRYERHRKL